LLVYFNFFFSSRRRHTISKRDWSSDVCSSDLTAYLFGKWLPYMIVVFAQIFVLFVFGKIVYNIPIEQPFQLLCLAIALTFTVTGIGLAIALIVKTFNMGLAITQILALGGAVLSGLWVPIEFMPHFIQVI